MFLSSSTIKIVRGIWTHPFYSLEAGPYQPSTHRGEGAPEGGG